MWTVKNWNLKATEPNGSLPGIPTMFAFMKAELRAVENNWDAWSTIHMYTAVANKAH